MLERHLVTGVLAGAAVAAFILAFRVGMSLLSIYSPLRSEGEEVEIAFMAVLFLGLLVLRMITAALPAIRLRMGHRSR